VTRVRAVSGWTFAAEVLRAPVPVVVDFRSPPEPPEPLTALAAEYDGRARVVTVDPAAEPELARCVLAETGPTILFFAAGRTVDAAPASASLADLREKLDRLVHPTPAGVG
jgi:thioredoxin-like negative regulator of GroEL